MSSNNRVKIILFITLLLGLTLRIWRLSANPVSTYWDETAIGYDAYSIAQTGKDMHGNPWYQAIFPSYGDYKLPLYIWLAVPLVKIFGPTAYAIRLVSALAGTTTILVMYGIAQRLLRSRSAGLATGIVFALLPWSIHFSRAAFEANLALLFVSLTFICLQVGLRRPLFIILAGLLGGISVYGYYSVRFVVPLLIISFALMYRRFLTKFSKACVMLSLLVFIALLLPIYRSPHLEAFDQIRLSTASLLNSSDHILEQNHYRELSGNSLVSRLLYHRHMLFARLLAVNLADHLSLPYLFLWGDDNLRHGTGEVGLAYAVLLPMFGIGLLYLGKQYRRELLLLLTLWLICLIPASVPTTTPHALRSLNAIIPFTLIIGSGAHYWITKNPYLSKRAAASLLGIALFFSFVMYWHDYWTHYPARSATFWQDGYPQLAAKLAQYDDHKVLLHTSDDRLFLYLLFYQSTEPSAVQGLPEHNKKSFKNYHFTHVNELLQNPPEPNTLYVLSPYQRNSLNSGWEVKDMVFSSSGQIEFILTGAK